MYQQNAGGVGWHIHQRLLEIVQSVEVRIIKTNQPEIVIPGVL